ncbi:MAG TPA: hypothetical protein VGO93_09520 [Candidatus Xenobia bacterium]
MWRRLGTLVAALALLALPALPSPARPGCCAPRQACCADCCCGTIPPPAVYRQTSPRVGHVRYPVGRLVARPTVVPSGPIVAGEALVPTMVGLAFLQAAPERGPPGLPAVAV